MANKIGRAYVTIAEWNEENGEAVAKSLREEGFK